MSFKCDKCGKTFITDANLKTHVNRIKPCISDEITDSNIKCKFCNNTFTKKYNLHKHYDRCAVRKNPDLLIKYIEKQDKIIEQKDEIIKQKDELIVQMKDTKPDINIDGNENNIDQSIDNSTHTKNIDNSTTINNFNITLMEQPYALRSEDMQTLIENMNNDPDIRNKFLRMRCVIMDNAKDGDIEASIETLMTSVHDNNEFTHGQNLRYCNSGIHKGKLLIYDYDENNKGYWYVADIEPVSEIISNEFKKFNDIHDIINGDGGDMENHITLDTKNETKNFAHHKKQSEMLHANPKHRKCIFKIVKDFKISEDAIPSNISDVKFTKLGKYDDELSCRAKLDEKKDDEICEKKNKKSKKINKSSQPSEADRIAKLERDNARLERENKKLEQQKIDDAKYENGEDDVSKKQREREKREMDNFKPSQLTSDDIIVIKDTKKSKHDSGENSSNESIDSGSGSDKKSKQSKQSEKPKKSIKS